MAIENLSQVIFPTTKLLKAGLKQLAYRHDYFEIVLCEKYIDLLKEEYFLNKENFDNIWANLQKENKIRVETLDNLTYTLDENLDLLLDEIAAKKIEIANRGAESHFLESANKSEILAQKKQVKRNLKIIGSLALKLKVPPLLLIPSADKEFYQASGFPFVEIKEFKKQSKQLKQIHRELFWAKSYDRLTISTFIIFSLLFILSFALGYSYLKSFLTGDELRVWKFLAELLLHLPNWIIIPLFAFLGFYSYWWRSVSRITYGIAEIFVGIIVVSLNIPDDTHRNEFIYWLPLLTAIYIIVRGFNNIGDSLNKYDKLKHRWSQIFGKNY
jgi:hypothetical protein